MTFRIEIAGSLASGKTTLCKQFEKRSYTSVFEDFSSNPYMDKVQQDPEKFGFLCQQWFVSNKIDIMSAAVAKNEFVVSDFSLLTDRAYIEYYLADKPSWVSMLYAQLDSGVGKIGRPDALVFLICPEEEQLRRIKSRGRAFEQETTFQFMTGINKLVRGHIDQARLQGIPVFEINTDKSDVRDEDVFNSLLQRLPQP